MNTNKLFFRFRSKSVILLIIFSLLVVSVFFFKNISSLSKAASGVPSLSYAIVPESVQAGQNFDLILQVNPNNATFNAFELYISYDPTKVEFQNTAELSQNIS